MNATGKEEDDLVLVNPTIVARAGDRTVFDEGCLSFPGIYAEVSRPDAFAQTIPAEINSGRSPSK